MPNPHEALTKAEPVQKNVGASPSGRGPSAPNHSPYATLHAYHPGGGQVNVEPGHREREKSFTPRA